MKFTTILFAFNIAALANAQFPGNVLGDVSNFLGNAKNTISTVVPQAANTVGNAVASTATSAF